MVHGAIKNNNTQLLYKCNILLYIYKGNVAIFEFDVAQVVDTVLLLVVVVLDVVVAVFVMVVF